MFSGDQRKTSKPEINGAEQPMIHCDAQSRNQVCTSVLRIVLTVFQEFKHTGSSSDGNAVNTSEDCVAARVTTCCISLSCALLHLRAEPGSVQRVQLRAVHTSRGASCLFMAY